MLRLIYIATAVLMLSLTFFGLWEKEVRGNHPFALPLDTYGPVDVSVSQTGNTFTFTWAGGQSNVWGSLFYGGESNNDDQIGRSVSSGITHDINTDGLWTFRILTTPSKSMVTFSNPLTLPAATLAATTDGFTASWTAYSGTSGYDVRWRPSSEGTWSTATVTTASYTATGLDTGTEYEFAYRLVSQHNVPTGSATRGRTDWSTNGTITTIVGPPDQMSISASPLDAHRVRVTWSPPHDGGAAITGYLLRYIPTGHGSVGSTWTQVEVSSGDTVYTLSGLSPGRRYGVQMLAKNSEGQRGWSESAFAQTQNAERSGPHAPPGRPGVSR